MRRIHLPAILLSTALAACGTDAAGGVDAALGAPEPIPSPAAPGSAEPNLAAGPDGRVLLSWVEPSGEGHALRFAEFAEDGWGEPRTVAEGDDWFVNWADFPALAPLADGALAAHWLRKVGAGPYAYEVRTARSADGGASWGASAVPHRDGTPTEHGFVSWVPLPGDSAGLVWLDGREYHEAEEGTEEMTLRFAAMGPDGGIGEEAVLDARTCDCCQTDAALTSAGPLVVYRDRSPEEVRDVYAVRRVDGRWTEPAPVHADGWVMPACPVNGPAVAADEERAAVAWYTEADGQPRVRLAFSDDAGATWSAPARVDDGSPLGRVDLLLLEDGSALVAWLERTADDAAEVRLRRVAPDGAVGESTVATGTDPTRRSGFPRMARADDAVVLAWTVPGDASEVRTARLALPEGW